jgi:hypothetical protein
MIARRYLRPHPAIVLLSQYIRLLLEIPRLTSFSSLSLVRVVFTDSLTYLSIDSDLACCIKYA